MWRRELLPPFGANPLRNFDVAGTTQRVPTPAHGYCIKMAEGSPPSRISIPKKGQPALNLRHRYLLIEVRTAPDIAFSVEATVRDTSQLSRTLILSNGCKVPELAKGGGAKAKLPMVAVPPPPALSGKDDPQDGTVRVGPGWRLAVFDLDMLIRFAFDGALYLKLDAVSLVGSCLVRSMAASAELPQIQPPGPVRLVPLFTARPLATVPIQIGVGGVGAAAAPPAVAAPPFADDADFDEFMPRHVREAREEALKAAETKAAIEEARVAEKEFLRASMAKDKEALAKVRAFMPHTQAGASPT